jgi:uncharacterized membrane protein
VPLRSPSRLGRATRGSEEFVRVLAFSDGVFAIAMTLLVAGLAVPDVAGSELVRALLEEYDDLFAFALSFAVIGFYWMAHHRFFRLLAFVDDGLVRINLAYMGLIAFLPFPTALLARYDGAATAVAMYACAVAAASLVEVLMLRRARRTGALTDAMDDDEYRHALEASMAPVAVFFASVPVAFAHPVAGMATWALIYPVEWAMRRRRNERARPGRGARVGRA